MSDLMRQDEVKTIFSVYRIWLEEGRDSLTANRHQDFRVAQIVHRQRKSLPHKKNAQRPFSRSRDSSFTTNGC